MKNRGAWERVRTLVCVAAMVFAALSAVADAKSCKLTFYGYSGTTTLTDFQALVRLPTMVPGFSYADFAEADGSDVWFTDEQGNVIPHEIDTWNTNGVSCLWVKVPELASAATFVTMHWGEAKTPEQAITPSSVWTDYKGVWHLAESSGTAVDSTANGLNGTPTGSSSADMVADMGIVGNARINSNVGSSDTGGCLLIPSYELGSTFTVSGWFRTSGVIDSYGRLFSRKSSGSGTGWEVYFYESPSMLGLSGNDGKQSNDLPIPSVRKDWVNVVAVYSGNVCSLYANGVLVGSRTVTTPTDNGLPLCFGGDASDSNYQLRTLCGKYDELRLRRGVLSADRIKADFDTVHAPELFLCGRDPAATTAKEAELVFYGAEGVVPLWDFQVLVKLPTAVSNFSYADYPTADGRDIWFTDEQGNVIPHEIDTWNAAGESYIWVKVPAIVDTASYITMHWGVAKTSEQTVDPTEVWNGYKGVWHLGEMAGVAADSTASNLPGIPSGPKKADMVADSGVVGNARFNSKLEDKLAGGYLSVPSYTLGSTFTVSGWFRTSMAIEKWGRLFSRKVDGNPAGWEVYMCQGPAKIGLSAGGYTQVNDKDIPSILDDWVNIVVVYSGKNCSVYANGAWVFNAQFNEVATDNNNPLSIGCDSAGRQYVFRGKYDELRLIGQDLSAGRIAADYRTIHDPVAFLHSREPDANRVVTAEWIGCGDVADLQDPANWRCLNTTGGVVVDGIPTNAYTRAIISGVSNFQLPANTAPLPWKRLVLGDMTLTAPADWRGLNPAETEIVGTIDLKGHALYLTEFPMFGTGMIVSTDGDEYVELRYLQSDVGSYIDSGFQHSANTVVDMRVEPVGLPANKAFTAYFGARAGNNLATSFAGLMHTVNNIPLHYACVNADEADNEELPSIEQFVPFDVHLAKNGSCTIDGEPLATGSGGGCALNDYIFCVNQGGVANGFSRVRLHYCKIYSGESLVRDFVPALHITTGELGLLDRQENKFYANCGDAQFRGSGPVLSGRTLAEVHVDVPEGKTVINSTVRFVGLVRLVKEGQGGYSPSVGSQFYVGGTCIEEGTVFGGDNPSQDMPRHGLGETDIRVCEGATMDMAGLGSRFYTYRFVVDGGMLKNSGADVLENFAQWADIKLESDSSVSLFGSYGIVNAFWSLGRIDLGGHTMNVDIGVEKDFNLFNTLVTNGLVKVVNGGFLLIDKGRLDARTVDFDLNCALKVFAQADVRDYTSRYTKNRNAGTAALNVHGVFTPVTDYFYGCTMQNGSTIDLSAKSAAWSTHSLFTQDSRDVSFADGAMVSVAIGKREIANGTIVVTWPQPPANLETLKFKIKERGRGRLLKTTEGLRYDSGFLVIVR